MSAENKKLVSSRPPFRTSIHFSWKTDTTLLRWNLSFAVSAVPYANIEFSTARRFRGWSGTFKTRLTSTLGKPVKMIEKQNFFPFNTSRLLDVVSRNYSHVDNNDPPEISFSEMHRLWPRLIHLDDDIFVFIRVYIYLLHSTLTPEWHRRKHFTPNEPEKNVYTLYGNTKGSRGNLLVYMCIATSRVIFPAASSHWIFDIYSDSNTFVR